MKHEFRKICVVGLGYIGLPTAAMFASRKIEVIGVDINQQTIETINRGGIHIVEPDLDMIVHAAVTEGYLRATGMPEPADAFVIAVPTPLRKGKNPDLSFVEAASRSVAQVLAPGNLIILESTCPVGTTELMAAWLAEARPDLKFPQSFGQAPDVRIAHCPERVMPGRVMQELVTNDRVIGGMTKRCADLAKRLYGTFVTGDCVVASNPRVAEMAKLVENSFRDVNIAFANELSLISDEMQIDVWELIALANRHPRVNILQPGPGVGGHCIAVDPWFIVSSAPERSRLIRTAREVNDAKPGWVVEKVHAVLGAHLAENSGVTAENVSLALYGLAFKPDIDDLRQSPALDIARDLASRHPGTVKVVEPMIQDLPEGLEGAELVKFADAADAQIHVLLVDHTSFKRAKPPEGRIVDSRGIWCRQ